MAASNSKTHSRQNAAQQRRLSQFSLRTALVLMLLSAVLLGAWRMWIAPLERQRAALKLLLDAGADVETKTFNAPWVRAGLNEELFAEPTHLNLENVEFRDDLLPLILRMRRLESLIVSGEGFAPAHLQELRRLPLLRYLILDSTSVSEQQATAFDEQHPDLKIHRSQARAIALFRSHFGIVNDVQSMSQRALRSPFWAQTGYANSPKNPAFGTSANALPRGGSLLPGAFNQRHFEVARSAALLRRDEEMPVERALAALEHFGSLVRLDVSCTPISDEHLDRFTRLPKLRSLWLRRSNVTDEGMKKLEVMEQIDILDIGETDVTDAGMASIGRLAGLRTLQLRNTSIGDEGLAHLAGLQNLEELDLRGTRVTDDGLAHVSSLLGLRKLYLANTAITDESVRHLRSLRNLEWLDLSHTSITIDGAERLDRFLRRNPVVR